MASFVAGSVFLPARRCHRGAGDFATVRYSFNRAGAKTETRQTGSFSGYLAVAVSSPSPSSGCLYSCPALSQSRYFGRRVIETVVVSYLSHTGSIASGAGKSVRGLTDLLGARSAMVVPRTLACDAATVLRARPVPDAARPCRLAGFSSRQASVRAYPVRLSPTFVIDSVHGWNPVDCNFHFDPRGTLAYSMLDIRMAALVLTPSTGYRGARGFVRDIRGVGFGGGRFALSRRGGHFAIERRAFFPQPLPGARVTDGALSISERRDLLHLASVAN